MSPPGHSSRRLAADEPAGEPDDGSLLREVDPLELSDLDPTTFLELIGQVFLDVAERIALRLPWLLVAAVVLLLLLVVGRLTAGLVNTGMRRAGVDFAVRRLVVNLLRVAVMVVAVLLALSLVGVDIGAALAAIGLVGLALAFALQNILENQISGILILTRKPFGRGDLILTNGYEGYVEDIDLRVTTLREHDGKTTLVPNADVLTNSLTNFTRRGTRRTTVAVGIDYRDDHHLAVAVLTAALHDIEGVLAEPQHEVLLVGFGDSSIDLEVRFWSDAENKVVRQTRHRVVAACKQALDAADITIPWPMRTLAADRSPLELRAGEGHDVEADGTTDRGGSGPQR